MLADTELPTAFVDLDALDRNAAAIRERAGGLPVRIASKSLRCPAVIDRLLDRDGFEGIMCYHGREAAFLAAEGFDDLLVAYPVPDRGELAAVCEVVADGTTVSLMVDSPAHVERAASVAAEAGVTLPLCLDADMSSEHFGVCFGTRRSPVRTPADATAVADAVAGHDAVTLDAVGSICGARDGRPHWGKRHEYDADDLAPRYPEWDTFHAVRREFDPEGLFLNDHLRGLFEGQRR